MNTRTDTVKGHLAIIATALLWSTGGLLIKLIPWAALSIHAARCIVAVLFRGAQRRTFRITLNWPTILGAVFLCGTGLCFSLANKYTTAANAILLQYTHPLFLMALTWIFRKRRPAGFEVFTTFVIIVGVFLCCYDSLAAGNMLGNIFGLFSGLFFALYFFLNNAKGFQAESANHLGFMLGILVGLPWLVRERVFSPSILLYIVILGALQIGLAYVLFEYGMRRVSALSAAFLVALEPILNPVWVAIFYGEQMGALAILGGILVVGAALLGSIRNARHASGVPAST